MPALSLSWSSFVKMWGRRRCWERFDYLVPPNFTRNFLPVGPITMPDMTSLTTSGWQLSKFKNGRKCHLRVLRCRISREPFELDDHVLQAHPHRSTLYVHNIWRQYLLPVWSYREKPSKMPPQRTSDGISRQGLQRGSPHFTWLSGTGDWDNWSHKSAGYDVTSCVESAAKCS